MTTNTTPGPWLASTMIMTPTDWKALNPGKHPIDIVMRGSDVIAAVWCGDDRDGEETANAHMMAASQDMYATLRAIRNTINGMGMGPKFPRILVEKIDAALAKAEGHA